MLRKIAHNTTVPALALGNRDLRQLQDLITAEKGVLQSLQKLAADVTKASDALRVWGQGEGEDLADVLTASAALLAHFTTALTTYSGHESSVREDLKSIRTREESLDELRARRKAVMAKADAADRKLSKMKPDNKSLQEQSDLVHKLREEIRIMDTDIMAEEASLGDYKRTTAKDALSLKFGGLVECCRKGAIAGEYGMMIIEEIPLEISQPGLPRPFYMGKSRTLSLMAEAQGAVSGVQFSAAPPDARSSYFGVQAPGYQPSASSGSPPTSPHPTYANARPSSIISSAAPLSPHSTGYSPGYGQPSGFAPFPQPQPQPSYGDAVSEFGYSPSVRAASMRPHDGGPRAVGARYSTVPSRLGGPRPQSGAAPPLDDRAPSLDVATSGDESFASSIASALGGPGQPSRRISMHKPPLDGVHAAGEQWQAPPPVYSPQPHPNALPPGAAPPQMYTGWSDQTLAGEAGPSQLQEQPAEQTPEQQEEEGLAYMREGREPSEGGAEDNTESADRRVTFDGDVGEPEGPHQSVERAPTLPAIDTGVDTPRPDQTSFHRREDASDAEVVISSPDRETHQEQEPSISEEPPTPSSHHTEESLNTIAAREVSRELDALMAGTYAATHRAPSPLLPPQAPFTRRGVSPRPDIESPSPAPLTDYLRERHRSPSNAASPALGNGSTTTLSSTTSANPYRTPLETPGSFYNLGGAGGSTPSVGGARTISAAAFRRQRQPTNPPDPSSGRTSPEANTNPLAINKRPLPQSPLGGPGVSPIPPALPTDGPRQGDSGRDSGYEGHGQEEEYDYISAYTQPREGEQDGLR